MGNYSTIAFFATKISVFFLNLFFWSSHWLWDTSIAKRHRALRNAAYVSNKNWFRAVTSLFRESKREKFQARESERNGKNGLYLVQFSWRNWRPFLWNFDFFLVSWKILKYSFVQAQLWALGTGRSVRHTITLHTNGVRNEHSDNFIRVH